MFHFLLFLFSLNIVQINAKTKINLSLFQQLNTNKIMINEGIDDRHIVKESLDNHILRNFHKKDLLDFLQKTKSTNLKNQQTKLNTIESQQHLFDDWENTSVYKPRLKSGLQSEFF